MAAERRWPVHGGAMQIFAKMPSGKTITLHVMASDTIGIVKGNIYEQEGTPPEQQRLIFAGQTLEDRYTLLDYNIRNLSKMRIARVSKIQQQRQQQLWWWQRAQYQQMHSEDEEEEKKETVEDVFKKELREERLRTGIAYQMMERRRMQDRHLMLAMMSRIEAIEEDIRRMKDEKGEQWHQALTSLDAPLGDQLQCSDLGVQKECAMATKHDQLQLPPTAAQGQQALSEQIEKETHEKGEQWHEAPPVLNQMREESLFPIGDQFHCSHLSVRRECAAAGGMVEIPPGLDMTSSNAVITAREEEERNVQAPMLDEMRKAGMTPTVISISAAISECKEAEQCEQAPIPNEMRKDLLTVNAIRSTAATSASGQSEQNGVDSPELANSVWALGTLGHASPVLVDACSEGLQSDAEADRQSSIAHNEVATSACEGCDEVTATSLCALSVAAVKDGFKEGTLVKWTEKGYGFIRPSDGGKDVFVYKDEVRAEHRAAGTAVAYKVAKKHGKERATAVDTEKVINTKYKFSWTAYLFSLNGFTNCKKEKRHHATCGYGGAWVPSGTAEESKTPSPERRCRAVALWNATVHWRKHAEPHEVEAWDWHVNQTWHMHTDEISQRRMSDEHGTPTDQNQELAGMMWANLLATEAAEESALATAAAEWQSWCEGYADEEAAEAAWWQWHDIDNSNDEHWHSTDNNGELEHNTDNHDDHHWHSTDNPNDQYWHSTDNNDELWHSIDNHNDEYGHSTNNDEHRHNNGETWHSTDQHYDDQNRGTDQYNNEHNDQHNDQHNDDQHHIDQLALALDTPLPDDDDSNDDNDGRNDNSGCNNDDGDSSDNCNDVPCDDNDNDISNVDQDNDTHDDGYDEPSYDHDDNDYDNCDVDDDDYDDDGYENDW